MRILHVIASFPPADKYGGPLKVADEMTQALADAGHDVTVFTTTRNGDADLDVPVDRAVARGRVDVRYFPVEAPRLWVRSPALARALRERVRDFDVVHVHGVFSHPTTAAQRLARRSGVPYVVRPAGSLDAVPLTHAYASGARAAISRWRKRAYVEAVERADLNGAAALHYTSEVEREGARHLRLRASAFVLPIGIRAPPDGAAAARAPWADRGGRTVLFLGRVDPIKGFDALVPAMARVARDRPDARLVIAGPAAPDVEAQLARAVAQHGLADRVERHGFVDGEAKWAMLRDADVFVLPSHHENFGVAAAEAMVVGTPVVVTEQVGLAPLVRAAGAGVVVPREADALADALGRLLDDDAARERAGRAAREAAERDLAWPVIVKELEARYAEARGGKPR